MANSTSPIAKEKSFTLRAEGFSSDNESMSSTEAKDIMINYSVLALTRVLSHLEKSTSGEIFGEFVLVLKRIAAFS